MQEQPKVSIDVLETRKSLIDLDNYGKGNFGLGDDFSLSFLFDDIVLVEFIDEVSDGKGDVIQRNGIFVPTNSLIKAWRKAQVILTGPSVKYCKKGDIVIFPNDKGASVANIEIEGYGRLKKGVFLNEQRLFGICKRVNADSVSDQTKLINEDIVTESKEPVKRKRM
jgi:cellobiose-specific phosphotransferase system component IIB